MFSYNDNLDEKKLYISMPSKIRYNFIFLNEITNLMKTVEQSGCNKLYFSSNEKDMVIDKLGAAYLFSTLQFFVRNKTVLIDRALYQVFHDRVSHIDGRKFEKIDIQKIAASKIQQCYIISDSKWVNQIVPILVDFIAENNLVLEDAKEFLITTIGEIFTNAFGHSNEKKVFFMYDIEVNNDKFYLVINIVDYGKTIIHNVQTYLKQNFHENLNSCECIQWAMEVGNTTRPGSGGYGLPTLKEYVSKIMGELLIFSGESIYALKGIKENIFNSKGEFYGTSISMKIPLFDTTKEIAYDEKNNKIISIDLDKL